MNTTKIIQQIVKRPPRIAVVGDYIEDRYILAEVTRISPEAPVPVARKIEEKLSHGGAGNVWATLTNLGCDAILFCDGTKEYWGEDNKQVFFNQNTHSVKTRVMSGNHHLLRIDEEPQENEILWGTFQSLDWAVEFVNRIENKEFDCVVIADYHKGVVSKSVAEMVVAYCQDFNVPCVVDAKKDFGRFAGATVLKCNQKEANEIEDIWAVIKDLSLRQFFITTGENGIDLYKAEAGSRHPYRTGGRKIPIVDVCGAGDTVTSIIAICMSLPNSAGVWYDIDTVADLANFVASEACKYPGVYLVTHEDLLKYGVD
jgi:D-beta-D-heptose 7-phosphate kinase/D-beta-D-heptose 1-phosphate adenosyltransferase